MNSFPAVYSNDIISDMFTRYTTRVTMCTLTRPTHTDFCTDLSWDGQSAILQQQWRSDGVGRRGLECVEDRIILYEL